MTKFYSELTQEQRAEVDALGYVPLFAEISEEALGEKIAKVLNPKTNGNNQALDLQSHKNAHNLFAQCLVQLQNVYAMKLWAQKQKAAELIGVIGEAYRWAEKTHKDFGLEPEDALVSLYETLKQSDQGGAWLEGTELVEFALGYTWEIK